jgi:hypothetical protein
MTGCFKTDDLWKLQSSNHFTFDNLDIQEYVDLKGSQGPYFGSFLLTLKSFIHYGVDIGILVLYIIDFPSLMKIILEGNGECDPDRYGAFACDQTFNALDDNLIPVSSIIPLVYRMGIIFLTLLFSFVMLIVDWYKVNATLFLYLRLLSLSNLVKLYLA